MSTDLINVVVTRDQQGLREVAAALDLGRFRIHPCGTITVRSVPHSPELAAVLGEVDTYDFVIFTSQHAVMETAKHLHHLDISRERLGQACVCAVGPATGQALEAYGVVPRVMPSKYTAVALAELFPVMRCHAPKVLFLGGNWASEVIARELTRKGYQVTSAVVYETSLRDNLDSDAELLISTGQADCIAFTSPSSVTALNALVEGSAIDHRLRRNTAIASIGPTTSAACAKAGLMVAIQPEDYTLPGLAKAIGAHFAGQLAPGQHLSGRVEA